QLGNGGTAGSLSTSSTITNNGNLTINRSNAVAQGTDFSGSAISGTGSFTQAGSGTTTLNTANTFTGSTTLTAGTLSVADTTYLGGATANNSIIFNGGTLQVTGTSMTSFGSHSPTFTATKTVGLDINNAGNTFTVSQALNQTTGGLTKSGAGTLTLSGTNTYTGATTVSGGTLKNGSATTFSASNTALSMSSTGVFDLNGFNASLSNIAAMVSTNTITNAGGSDAVLSVTGEGSVSLAGLFTDGSTNKLGISMANVNATPQFTNTANTFSGGLNLLNNATGTRLYVNSAISFAGTPGALTSSNFGTGTITIGQTGTDKAGIRFDTAASGTMANAIVFNTALGTDLVGISSTTTSGVTLAGAITANSNAAFNTSASSAKLTVSGAISGSGGVVVTQSSGSGGIVTLSGANNYLGATTITSGTLQFAKTNSMSSSSAVSVASGATLAVNAGGSGEFSGGSGNGTIGGLFAGLGGQSGSTVSYTAGSSVGVDTSNAGSTVTESTNLTVSGVGLTKLGTGTLLLSGNNTYNGPTTVSGGALEYQAATAMSSSSALTIASGGTLSLRADANTTFTPASITGSAGTSTITVNQITSGGAGKTLTLANSYTAGASGSSLTVSSTSGDTLLLSSQLNMFNASGPSTTINLSGANLTLNAGVNFNGATNGPLLTVNANSNTLLINGNYTTGGNRWAGITVNNGTLTMANGQTGGSGTNSGVYAVLTGGTLNLNNANAIGGAAAGNTFGISGGTLDNTSGSSKTLSKNPLTTINGNFAFSTSGGTNANDLNLGTGTVSLGTTAGTTRTITSNGSATLTLGGIISNGTTANGLIKAGTGGLTLSAANTYSGGTSISAGTLSLSGSGTFGSGSLTSSGGTVDLGTKSITNTLGALTGGGAINNGTVTNNSSAYDVQSGSVGAILAGSNSLTKSTAGAVTLSGANTYSSGTSVSAGTLTLSGSGTFGSGSLTSSGGTVDLGTKSITNTLGALTGGGAVNNGTITNNSGNYDLQSGSIGAILAGSNGLIKSTSSTVTLSGVNTYSGDTAVRAGILALGLNGTDSDTLVLGVASSTQGTLDVTAKSAFSQANVSGSGTINIGSGKTVTVTNSLAPGFSPGTVNVTGDLALTASTSTTLELAGNGGVQGTDSDYVNVSGSMTLDGLLAITSYGGYDLTQTASYNLLDATSFTGDFDAVSVGGNALSFASDVWSGTSGSITYSFSETTGVLTVVPEPSALLLGGLGVLALLRRRR
ncbi:MAG: autotransporter-associated beta strand repeat-containing protein, partial [Luteolibacter sp.]